VRDLAKTSKLERDQVAVAVLFLVAVVAASFVIQFIGSSNGVPLTGIRVQGISTSAEESLAPVVN
jgi:hypothetical protein